MLATDIGMGENRGAQSVTDFRLDQGRIDVDLAVSGATELTGYGITIEYDPALVTFSEATDAGGLLQQEGDEKQVRLVKNWPGLLMVAAALKHGSTAHSSAGMLTSLRFDAVEAMDGNPPIVVREMVLADGNRTVDRIIEGSVARTEPDGVHLKASPNPSNPQTTIEFTIPAASRVTLYIYDLLGQRIRTLASDDILQGGAHSVVWDGHDESGRGVASGTYFVRLGVNSRVYRQKVTILR